MVGTGYLVYMCDGLGMRSVFIFKLFLSLTKICDPNWQNESECAWAYELKAKQENFFNFVRM